MGVKRANTTLEREKRGQELRMEANNYTHNLVKKEGAS